MSGKDGRRSSRFIITKRPSEEHLLSAVDNEYEETVPFPLDTDKHVERCMHTIHDGGIGTQYRKIIKHQLSRRVYIYHFYS